jgi:hypothetical protein
MLITCIPLLHDCKIQASCFQKLSNKKNGKLFPDLKYSYSPNAAFASTSLASTDDTKLVVEQLKITFSLNI